MIFSFFFSASSSFSFFFSFFLLLILVLDWKKEFGMELFLVIRKRRNKGLLAGIVNQDGVFTKKTPSDMIDGLTIGGGRKARQDRIGQDEAKQSKAKQGG